MINGATFLALEAVRQNPQNFSRGEVVWAREERHRKVFAQFAESK
jgi:hypothetical protein